MAVEEAETVTIPRALYEETLAKLRAVAAERSAVAQLREQIDQIYATDAVERGAIFLVNNYPRQSHGRFGYGPGRAPGRAPGSAGGTSRQPRQPRQPRGARGRAGGSSRSQTQTAAERELEAATREHEAAKQEFDAALRAQHDAHTASLRAAQKASVNGPTFVQAREELRQQELTRAATRAPRSYQRILDQRAKAEELKQEAIKAGRESEKANYRLGKMYVDKREAGMSDAQIKRDPEYRDALREGRAKQQLAYRAGNKATMADYGARAMEDRLIGNRVTREAIDAHPLMQQAQHDFDVARAAHEAAARRSEAAGNRVDAAAIRLRQAHGALDLERGGPGIQYEPDAEAEKSWRGVFGRDFSTGDLAKLSGAGLGDKVTMSEEGNRQFSVHVEGHINRDFSVGREGSVITLHDGFTGNEGAKTTSSGAELIRGMENMRELGVTKIECSAARSAKLNGYYTWAKIGFRGRIPGNVLGKVHAEFGPRVNRIEQLMGTRRGSAWWKQNGSDWQATFDFRNSYSMGRLNDFKRILGRHQNSGGGA